MAANQSGGHKTDTESRGPLTQQPISGNFLPSSEAYNFSATIASVNPVAFLPSSEASSIPAPLVVLESSSLLSPRTSVPTLTASVLTGAPMFRFGAPGGQNIPFTFRYASEGYCWRYAFSGAILPRLGPWPELRELYRHGADPELFVIQNDVPGFYHLSPVGRLRLKELPLTARIGGSAEPDFHHSIWDQTMRFMNIRSELTDTQEITVAQLSPEHRLELVAALALHAEDGGLPRSEAVDLALMAMRRKLKKDAEALLVAKAKPSRFRMTIEEFKRRFATIIKLHPVLEEFCDGLLNMTSRIMTSIEGVLAGLLVFFKWTLTVPLALAGEALAGMVEQWCDEFLPASDAVRRVKSIWSLGGVIRDPYYVELREFLASAELMKFEANTFTHDYDKLVDDLTRNLPTNAAPDASTRIGGDQKRTVHLFKRPVMSAQEAKLLDPENGLRADEPYAKIQPRVWDELTRRTQSYLDKGVKLGTDGVNAGYQYPNLIADSIERYGVLGVPAPLTSTEKEFAAEIARAMVDKFPEAYADMRVTPAEAIFRYSKQKYSPGTPFIGHYQSRAEMYNAGWKPAIINTMMERIKHGEYRSQFYHAFAKSQVVEGGRIILGEKNLRTVVAEDLLSYYVDQFAQLERNKRDVWRETMTGIGMPLNQNMISIFEKLPNYAQILALDASEFDSRLGPFAFEGLSWLAAYGATDPVEGPIIKNILRSKYDAMMNGFIWGVTIPRDAGVPYRFQKLHGGGTGQSATGWDNTAALKILMCATWCDYWRALGRNVSPKDFFNDTFLANTGDDNMFGLQAGQTIDNLPLFLQLAAVRGLYLRVEGEGMNALYLGHGARLALEEDRVALDYWYRHALNSTKFGYLANGLKPEIPDAIVYQDTSALLLRRTALRYYQADPTQVRTVLLERSIGHAMLCAFNPSLYHLIAHEYYDDVRQYLGPLRTRVKWKHNRELNMYEIELDGAAKPLFEPNQRYLHRYQHIKKALKFPSYLEVLRVHMKPAPKILGKAEYKRQKLLFRTGNPDDSVKAWLELFRAHMDGIPRELYKAMPGLDILYPEPAFETVHQVQEAFIYKANQLEIEGKDGATLKPERFTQLVSQSAYGAGMAGGVFLTRLADPKFRQDFDKCPIEALHGAVLCTTLVYWLTYYLEKSILKIPIIGTIWAAWTLLQTRLPKLYGALNLCQSHWTGRSSTTISAIMPRDPYIYSKQFATFVVDVTWIPLFWLYYLIGVVTWPLGQAVVQLCDQIAEAWLRLNKLRRAESFGAGPTGDNEWLPVVPILHDKLRDGDVIVSAPTGTGKSTWLMRALLDLSGRYDVDRIIHLVPRKVLRDDTVCPGPYVSQVCKAGVSPDFASRHLIMTYGHFLETTWQRSANDIYVFDEFHECTAEMLLATKETQNARRLFLSATPVNFPYLRTPQFYQAPVKGKGFQKTVERVSGSTLDRVLWLLEHHKDKTDRVAVVVPTFKKVDQMIESLRYLKVGEVSEFSARNRKLSETANWIVCTPLIDAGYDAKPPFTALVDSGTKLFFNRGQPPTEKPTDAVTHTQRVGRVGRLKPGIVITSPSAGTGPTAVPYPAPARCQDPDVANFFSLPPLLPVSSTRQITTHLGIKTTMDHPNLRFVGAAILAGVISRDMPQFYMTHVNRGLPLNEDHSWLQQTTKELTLDRTIPWDEIARQLLDHPFILNHSDEEHDYGFFVPINGRWAEEAEAETVPSQEAIDAAIVNTFVSRLQILPQDMIEQVAEALQPVRRSRSAHRNSTRRQRSRSPQRRARGQAVNMNG